MKQSLRRPLLRLPLLVLLTAVLITPGGAAARAPDPGYRLNLYRAGDFVSQYTLEWCSGASMQMMLNMGQRTDDRTFATQQRLWELARARSESRWGGANRRGWAIALTELGAGSYGVRSAASYEEALRMAAVAIRRTGRPVGLLTWKGAHAWVMHGFTATADPATSTAFQVSGAFVSDPFYPRTSSTWGRSAQPNAWLTPAQLREDFVPWKRRRHNPRLDGRFVLVVPTLGARPADAAPGVEPTSGSDAARLRPTVAARPS